MPFFKSSKKQSTTVPAPALAQDSAPPPYSPQDPAQEKAPKPARKMTQEEAFSSLIEVAWGAPDKDTNLGSANAMF